MYRLICDTIINNFLSLSYLICIEIILSRTRSTNALIDELADMSHRCSHKSILGFISSNFVTIECCSITFIHAPVKLVTVGQGL